MPPGPRAKAALLFGDSLDPFTCCLGNGVDNAAPSPKICTVCGQDCSNKPRTKDAQGRYVCKECMQRAQSAQLAKQDAAKPKAAGAAGATAGASAAGDQGDNAFLLDIIEAPKVREGQKPCPACGKGINEGAVLCTSCGFNLKTGERALVNVLKPVEIRDKSERNRSGGGGIPEWLIGVAALVILGGLYGVGVATQNPNMINAAAGIHFLYAITTIVLVLVYAFKDSITTGLLIPLTCFLYALIWVPTKCPNDTVKYMYLCAIVLGIAASVLKYSNPELFPTGAK